MIKPHLVGVADVDRRKGDLLQRCHSGLDGGHRSCARILRSQAVVNVINMGSRNYVRE